MSKHKKIAYLSILPFVLVAVYIAGLFLLSAEMRFVGYVCMASSVVGGIIYGVWKWRNRYVPSRSKKAKWQQFIGKRWLS
ncbi:MAG: hypothetical protein P9L88_01685 [Candidatus Tantalella remota]|nr:hypothetical protein [Candidatus Tantalella remota]